MARDALIGRDTMGKNGRAQKMTAEDATTFRGVSVANAAQLLAAAEERGCTCMPYEDWFTYGRWHALGYQVQRGEHGVHLPVIIEKEQEDGETKRYPGRTTVFCRCQVKPLDAPQAHPLRTDAGLLGDLNLCLQPAA